MDVRRDYDNTTGSIGYVSNGDLDTGSLLDFVVPGRSTLPGNYSGLAAAYSLRKVSGSYTGSAVRVRGDIENQVRDIGFDASGNLDTGSLLNFTATGSNTLPGSYSGLAAAYSLRRVVPGYSGNLIEVRSGSVSQSIGVDSLGNLDTGSLLTFAGSGNVFVKTWFDQSGNNYHVTQSVDANQPQIVSNGSIITENGKPVISHSVSQILGLTSSINLGKTYSIFTTFKFSTDGRELIGDGTVPYSYAYYQQSNVSYHGATGFFGSTTPAFGLNYALLSVIRTGSVSVSLYRNSGILGSPFNLSSNADFSFRYISGENNTAYNFITYQ
jgi:hypothetical protein